LVVASAFIFFVVAVVLEEEIVEQIVELLLKFVALLFPRFRPSARRPGIAGHRYLR
jgi:hypothetical protein